MPSILFLFFCKVVFVAPSYGLVFFFLGEEKKTFLFLKLKKNRAYPSKCGS